MDTGTSEAPAAHDRAATGFHALLSAVGGAAAYLRLRARLVAKLSKCGARLADDLADETLDRVATKLGSGEPVRDPERYALGVARLVALEDSRRWSRHAGDPDELATQAAVSADLADTAEATADRDGALATLPDDERELLRRYAATAGRDRGAARRSLAAELGIGVGALRLRVHRARKRLRAATVTPAR